jgi:hypothetical protein
VRGATACRIPATATVTTRTVETGTGGREPERPGAPSRQRRRGQLAEAGRTSAGREPGHDLLDLGFPLPTRRRENGPVVVGRQVRAEQPHGGEVDRAVGEEVEDDREAAGRARGLDAVVGLVLGERENVPAVDEEGRVAGAQVHVPRVELGQMHDEESRRAAFTGSQALHSRDELVVGQPADGAEEILPRASLPVVHSMPPGPEGSYAPHVPQWVRTDGLMAELSVRKQAPVALLRQTGPHSSWLIARCLGGSLQSCHPWAREGGPIGPSARVGRRLSRRPHSEDGHRDRTMGAAAAPGRS